MNPEAREEASQKGEFLLSHLNTVSIILQFLLSFVVEGRHEPSLSDTRPTPEPLSLLFWGGENQMCGIRCKVYRAKLGFQYLEILKFRNQTQVLKSTGLQQECHKPHFVICPPLQLPVLWYRCQFTENAEIDCFQWKYNLRKENLSRFLKMSNEASI